MNMSDKTTFINQFVNSVYGVLLGFGFCNAMQKISQDFIIFHFAVVMFAILVLCIHWWDWMSNIKKYVKSSAFEFSIDILILLTIEWMFFEYQNFLIFIWLLAGLGFMNFLWVLHFRITQRYNLQTFFSSKSKFSKEAFNHILKRFLGFIIYILLSIGYSYFAIYNMTLLSNEILNWIFLIILMIAFLFDRMILYRNRKFDI